MCDTCGCSDEANIRITDLSKSSPDHGHEHTHVDEHGNVYTHSHGHDHAQSHDDHHGHDHHHDHQHDHHGHAPHHDHHDHEHHQDYEHTHIPAKIVSIEQDVLSKNNALASKNRSWLQDHQIVAINLLSAPGSGKTTLLERTINSLKSEFRISVLEGDQETINDAVRIKATGCPVVQINTGAGCHLEADMISSSLQKLNPPNNSLLFIENVGNLVCPALFDLGEEHKVVVLSVTEGEDKPLKYPHMFRAANTFILNKIDLLPHLEFNVAECIKNALDVNPNLRVIQLSARTGQGMADWLQLLKEKLGRFTSAARS